MTTCNGVEASLAAAVGVDVVMERDILRVIRKAGAVPINKKNNKELSMVFRSSFIVAERITVVEGLIWKQIRVSRRSFFTKSVRVLG